MSRAEIFRAVYHCVAFPFRVKKSALASLLLERLTPFERNNLVCFRGFIHPSSLAAWPRKRWRWSPRLLLLACELRPRLWASLFPTDWRSAPLCWRTTRVPLYTTRVVLWYNHTRLAPSWLRRWLRSRAIYLCYIYIPLSSSLLKVPFGA